MLTSILPDLTTTDSASTPIGNTGVDSQTALSLHDALIPSIDYCSLVWTAYEHERVVDRINSKFVLNLDFESVRVRSSLNGGDESVISGNGCMLTVRYSDCEVEPQTWYKLEISGVGCCRFGTVGLSRLMGWFHDVMKAHCTRLDIKVDDYKRSLCVSKIRSAIALGQFSGFKNRKFVESVNDKFHGWTFYLGSRKADKFIRIYDKYAESKGLHDCIRYEVEYKSISANEIFSRYVHTDGYQEKQDLLSAIVAGSCSFIDKKDKNLNRGELLDWWSDFIDRISCELIKIAPVVPPTTISKKLDWVVRNVAKALSILHQAIGVQKVDDIIYRAEQRAKSRISNYERNQIKMYREYSMNI
jgi:DNA relaxase NicK